MLQRLVLPAAAGLALLIATSGPIAAQTGGQKPPPQSNGPREATVAQDGSGTYRTVQEAIAAAPTGTREHPAVIHVKPGTYWERLYVQREKRFLRLVGEDAKKTVVTFDLTASAIGPDGKPIGTFRTPTAEIDGDDFTAENLTFENSAGNRGQALAVRVDGDRAVFRHCRFLGWQDTILCNRGRHYFEDCEIAGAVDFIFGAATAYFDRCRIRCLGSGYVTAASTPQDQPAGFVFRRCEITGASSEVKTYLGRPWRDYANVVFLECEMSAVVRPEGWSNWRGTQRDRTARFTEYRSAGQGADPAARVPWSRQLSEDEARRLTPERVLAGSDRWKP